MEYVGGANGQVKCHGYRVELNEIRSATNGHPQTRDSVVVVRQDEQGHRVMLAYYASLQEVEVGTLRTFLTERLLVELIPNVFVHLKKLP